MNQTTGGVDLSALAVGQMLLGYFAPAASSPFIDVRPDAPGIAVAVAETEILSVDLDLCVPYLVVGWSTSPTTTDVAYRLLADDRVLASPRHQPSPTLWELQPLGLLVQGPVTLKVLGGSLTGAPVAAVFARVVAYPVTWKGGGPTAEPIFVPVRKVP